LDRFFFQINIDYPTAVEELEILKRTTGKEMPQAGKVLSKQEVLEIQNLVREVPVGDHIENLAVHIARLTRPKEPGVAAVEKDFIAWGAGPRATQTLVLASKARALLYGRNAPSLEDIVAVAYPALRHRLILNFHAHAQNVSSEKIIEEVLKSL